MNIKKARKPRTKSKDLGYDGCHMFGQPYNSDTPAAKKLYDRLTHGLCLGCGQKDCRCKSSSK
jgi:hypothetical protein